MPSYTIEKCVQGSFSQSHLKFGETAGIQCACNALLAVCWATVCKVSCWLAIDLDHVLDLGDNLFKHLEFNKYLDASDLQQQIVLGGFSCSITKLNLNDGVATIGIERFLLNPFQNRQTALLFMNGTVTSIVELSRAFYLFDSHSRNRQGLSDSYGSSVLLKLKLEHAQGRERQYFQLLFLDIQVDNMSEAIFQIHRTVRRLQKNKITAQRQECLSVSDMTVQHGKKKERMREYYKNIKEA